MDEFVINEELVEVLSDEKDGFKIVNYGDRIDLLFGVRYLVITEEDITALRNGKLLYTDDDEYVTLICLKKGERNERQRDAEMQ